MVRTSANESRSGDIPTCERQIVDWIGGRVRLGRGAIVGTDSVMEYQDPSPIPVNYLAFAGWDVPGTALVRRGTYHYVRRF